MVGRFQLWVAAYHRKCKLMRVLNLSIVWHLETAASGYVICTCVQMCKTFFLFLFFRYMGTITGISDLDPVRWPNSYWRSVKVLELFSWHACINHYNVAYLVLCIWRERILCRFFSRFFVRKCNLKGRMLEKKFVSVFF
jgi:hypothetical protein